MHSEDPNRRRAAARLYERQFAELGDRESVDIESLREAHPELSTDLDHLHRRWLQGVRGLIESGVESAGEPADELGGTGGPALPPSLAERLEILEELGTGAFGQVYRARDQMLGREVALKVMNEGAFTSGAAPERFLEEARTLAALKHPNIVQIHWIEELEGRVYMILELVRGRTLAEIQNREGTLAPAEAARIGADLCRALAALHGRGLVHMDIKPANIVREEGGRIVLLDFGLARATFTPPGAAAGLGGTPRFMSPEVLEGRAEIPPASDIFSLGVLLYWAVSNRYPHEGTNLRDLRERTLEGDATPLMDVCPGVPPAFAAVVTKAISRQPDDRHASAGALEQALSLFLAGSSASPSPANHIQGSGTAIAGRRAVLASAVFLFGALAWFLATRGEAPPPPLDFQCQLFARRNGVDVPLGDAASVAVGDRVFLRARADRRFHLYVFNEDAAGRSYTLFPIPDLGLHNPVPGGALQQLPGGRDEEDREYWKVTTAGGGAEYLYVVASGEPLESMELLRSYVPDASRNPEGTHYSQVSSVDRVRVMRGIGGLVGGDSDLAGSSEWRLAEVFSRLERSLDESRQVVVQRIALSN